MGPVFNAEEILEIACQLERNGAAFYNKAAKIVKNDGVRKRLEELALMEVGHESLFETMRADQSLIAGLVDDPDDTAGLYLKALAGGHIFDDPDNPATQIDESMSEEQILRRAIYMELLAIAFFQSVRDSVPESLGKKKIDGLVREEMSHVTLLEKELSAIKGQ
jgi:rubrerythrin